MPNEFRLNKTEVERRARAKSVVRIELDLCRLASSVHKVTSKRCRLSLTRVSRRPVKPIVCCDVATVLGSIDSALEDPNNLLYGVVEVHLARLLKRRLEGDRLGAVVLELLHEVLMGLLGKPPSLFSIKIHVVYVELSVG